MEEKESRKKKQVTSLFIMEGGENTWDFLEDFYLQKAIHEKKLGRPMTRNESHDFFVKFSKERKKDKDMERIDIDKDPEDVKAMLSEHLNVKDYTPKRKDKKGGTD